MKTKEAPATGPLWIIVDETQKGLAAFYGIFATPQIAQRELAKLQKTDLMKWKHCEITCVTALLS
jgi:hypothetical protein